MADYNAIAEHEVLPGAPLNTALFSRIVRNPEAMFAGAPGAPRLALAALSGEVQAGDASGIFGTRSWAYPLSKGAQTFFQMMLFNSGSVRLRIEIASSAAALTAYVDVVLAGVVVQTWQRSGDYAAFSIDLPIARGDVLQLRLRGSNNIESMFMRARNLGVKTDGGTLVPFGIVGDAIADYRE